MKGVVFVALSEMIQNNYGYRTWNEIIDQSNLESEGVYTTTESYNDEEAVKLLQVISQKLNKRSSDVLKLFGLYLIKFFNRRYPQFFESKNLTDFLLSIESIIHVEIKKISPGCAPPNIKAKVIDDETLVVYYSSSRKLCSLAIGLIKGSSKIFGEKIDIEHGICMHDGNDHCELIVRKK